MIVIVIYDINLLSLGNR